MPMLTAKRDYCIFAVTDISGKHVRKGILDDHKIKKYQKLRNRVQKDYDRTEI